MAFSILSHFQLKAGYNRRLNQQVYEAASSLTDEERKQDRQAIFHSIHQTLNHLMVADIIWLTRFSSHRANYQSLKLLQDFPKPSQLDEIIFTSFSDLRSAREKLDLAIIEWLEKDVLIADFDAYFDFKSMKGIPGRKNFGEVVLHLFNHQTHHRGQVSTLLSQFKIDIGITDFLIDIPNEIDS